MSKNTYESKSYYLNKKKEYECLLSKYNNKLSDFSEKRNWGLKKSKYSSVEINDLRKEFMDLHSDVMQALYLIKEDKKMSDQLIIENYETLLLNINRRVMYLDSYYILQSFQFTISVAYYSILLGILALFISIISLMPMFIQNKSSTNEYLLIGKSDAATLKDIISRANMKNKELSDQKKMLNIKKRIE